MSAHALSSVKSMMFTNQALIFNPLPLLPYIVSQWHAKKACVEQMLLDVPYFSATNRLLQ